MAQGREDDEESMRKCVSFSENISYHSPSNSLHDSTNKHTCEANNQDRFTSDRTQVLAKSKEAELYKCRLPTSKYYSATMKL